MSSSETFEVEHSQHDENTSKFSKWLEYLEVSHENRTLSVLRNPDIEPMPVERRIWGIGSFAGYWGIPNINIGTWSGGSSLLALGLNVGNAMGAIVIANIILTIYTILNSFAGSKWHIGYTISQRIVFGIYGSGLGIFIRVVLSIVSIGSSSWVGGLCISIILSSWSHSFFTMKNTFASSVAMETRDFVGFVIFQIISMFFYFLKPEKMNIPFNVSCFVTFFAMLGMVIWACKDNGGAGDLFATKMSLSASGKAWAWLNALTIWFGGLSSSVTNQSDYSRFAKDSKSVVIGVPLGLMIFGTIIPLFGIIACSAMQEKYDAEYWMPTDILFFWLENNYNAKSRAGAFFCAICLAVSQLTGSTVASGFAGGMDLAAVLPKYIDIKRGAIIVALLSWVVQPWTFYNSSSTFNSVMASFGVVVTPIIAVLVADYFVARKRNYTLSKAYTLDPDGPYYYTYGVNFRAMFAWSVGMAPGLPGIANSAKAISVSQGVLNYYMGDVIFGFLISFSTYSALALIFPMQGAGEKDEADIFNAFSPEECKYLGLIPFDDMEKEAVIDGILVTELSREAVHIDGVTIPELIQVSPSKEKFDA